MDFELKVENFKSLISELANITLDLDESWKIENQLYDWENLIDWLLVFMHIFQNIAITKFNEKNWGDMKKAEKHFLKMWKELKELIFKYTWIDTEETSKRLYK